ncbi:MAG: DNA polymerase III subunit delta [Chitinophagaceae bacterium]|nr:DNA polymerase III subunit delta [Chitinophagaceae bacterium]
MSTEKIIADWKKKVYHPLYWLEGEESFYIDQVVEYAEHSILSEAEASFNLTIFYGKDANWTDIVNACRRYPMFGERQVVIIKEAQQMRDVEKLEAYISAPLVSTILVVAHKEKKVDGRSRLAKYLKQNAVHVITKKMYDSQLPEWTNELVQSKGYTISKKALALLVDHIGNDISRINNEIDKLLINLINRKNITEEDIEEYVGISKEYNVFELQEALQRKDVVKAMHIIQYFESNPKAAPIQLVLPSLYNFFSKVYMLLSLKGDDKTVASTIGVSPFFMKDYKLAATTYGFSGVENVLLLLHHYNLRSIGVNDAGTEDASLLKEMIVKMTL